ncbi:MAG TPA: ATP synthase F0 subunit B [Candidatus Binatia bacterium]|jgi:F0F1-type ATP synthase membrane subunit b/b'
MEFQLDSFLIQIASFVILWLGLKRLLFDPALQVLEAREARTSGLAREAAEMKSAADRSAAEYEARMREIRHQLAVEAEAARVVTRTQERQVISVARDQVSHQLMQLRDTLSRQAEEARPALAAEARDLSARMLERVVGRRLA